MTSVDAINGYARSAAAALVDREVQKTGSRMVAYEIVAQMVGVSSSWLRKYLAKREEAKEPGVTVGFNIIRQYECLCLRIEEDNAARLQRIQQLKEDIHAAAPRIVGEALAVAGGTPTEETKG